VAEAGAAAMINHRGPEFAALLARIEDGLKLVYRTQNEIAILTASGTGGMEAAVVNHVNPGDRVLVVTIGVFGERFLELVRIFGGDPVHLAFDYGTGADPNAIDEALAADGDIRAVFVTHNETSTGATNPLEQIASVVRGRDRLLIVDAISSLSSIPVETDAWGLDVVVSGSQKGWMVAPGLAFVSVSDRAWEVQERCTTPRAYLDLRRARSSAATGQTPWTPAVSLFYQLDKALQMIREEGVEQVWERHHRTAERVRTGLVELGLGLFADEAVRSDTVTAIRPPEGVSADELRKIARDEFDTVFAGGQRDLGGKIFRFGHLGYCAEDDVRGALAAIEGALVKLGHAVPARG
jgi:aspartate aminotransferase-like enzyme